MRKINTFLFGLLGFLLVLPVREVRADIEPFESVLSSDVDDVPEFGVDIRPQDVAVVIGLEKYRDLPSSDYSASDALIFKKYLKALGFEERNIQLLLNDRATLTDMKKSLERWMPNRVKADSRVFVYYSGHGSPDPSSGEGYLVPYDGDPNYLEDSGYPLKRLYAKVGRLPATEVIVLLDACFSGAGGRSVLAKGARPLVMTMKQGPALPPHMAVLSATQDAQISTSSPEKKHGIFTYFFLKALREGKNGLSQIYKHIRPKVEDEAKRLNVQQSPTLRQGQKKADGFFKFKMDFKPRPPQPKIDVKALKKIQEEKKALEQEKKRLAEEKKLMEEKEEKRRLRQAQEAEERRRMEAEKRRLQQEKKRLRKMKKDKEPAFVPPTF